MLSRRKGQVLVFEQVMLFFIGVTIFLVAFSFFLSYQEYASATGTRDQLQETAGYLSWKIISLGQKAEQENATLTVSIPKKAGDESYDIRLFSDGLLLRTTQTRTEAFSPLCMLNQTMKLSGGATSAFDTIVIYKKGKEIIIS
jgi:hypothetical protein